MAIYTYQVVNKDGSEGEIFEVVRGMTDPPLEAHPDTGQKVKRIYQPIHIAGITNERHSRNRMSDKNLAKNGFTKFVKNGKGNYERTVGSAGPETISTD